VRTSDATRDEDSPRFAYPKRLTCVRVRAREGWPNGEEKRARRARRASGSVDSPIAVEPVTSQKRTVTVFRCSREAGAVLSGAAQNGQKGKSPGGRSLPHDGQVVTRRV
jgi:hypothetical protein